ncbi:MAG: M48 family metallopeptidase [Candidatus Micrarchaeota archaeon]
MTYDKISFFDAAAANKTKSVVLLVFLFLFYLVVLFVFSYVFELGVLGFILGVFSLFFYALITYYAGDQILLSLSGAKKIEQKDFPYIFNTVEGLALAAQISTPQIYLISDDSPNAFATGRDPAHSALAMTTGLLQLLNREEIEGVIAHEMSHIANFDIRMTMIATVFGASIALLSGIATRMLWFGGGRRDRDRGSGGLALLGILFLILAPIFAQLAQLALSRQREYLADTTGARMIRNPNALANALEKIGKSNVPLENVTDATAGLYFALPKANGFFQLFATHPPIEERIKRLRGMY